MTRIAANGAVLTLFLLRIICISSASFISRSPLYMTSNRNNSGDSNNLDISSVSASPSPLLAEKRRNDNNNYNRQKIYREKGRPTSTSSSSSSSSSSTSTIKATKRAAAAPLVDSTLLRFLSAQKNQIAAQEETLTQSRTRTEADFPGSNSNNNNNNNNNNSNNNGISSSEVEESLRTNGRNKNKNNNKNNKGIRTIKLGTDINDYVNETELIQSMTDNLMVTENEIENETYINGDHDTTENKNTEAKVMDSLLLDNDNQSSSLNTSVSVSTSASASASTSSTKKKSTSSTPAYSMPSSSSQLEDTTAESISWFTQYNAHSVAKKLVEVGATESCGQDAGNAVQNYSLTRTTRQKVRKFLRDRDSIWASSSSTTTTTSPSFSLSNRNQVGGDGSREREQESQYSYNIDSIIEVLIEAGLTGKDIAAIFTHTPAVSMMKARKDNQAGLSSSPSSSSMEHSLEESLERAYHGVLCSVIKLRKYDARKVLRSCPGLLTKRGSVSSEEVVSILANLGVSPASLCRDKSALPILLSRSPGALFRLVAFLSSDAVRMPVNRVGPLFRRSECASLLDFVAPLSQKPNLGGGSLSVENLFNSGGIGGGNSNEVIETEITRRYKMMFKTAKYLRREVGIQDLGRSIAAYPNILTLEIEREIAPCVEFLCEEVGIYEEEIPRILELYPRLLGANITEMRGNLDYFESLEVSEDDMGSIFRAFPALLTMEISHMDEVVDFLKEAGVSNIGRFVTRLPPVLGYSVERDLVPKWNYLRKVRQYASFEISRFPAYFSYPLDRVIKCRYEYLHTRKHLPIQLIPLDEVLRYGDRDFAVNVAKDDDGSFYSAFVENRKKNQKQQSRKRRRKRQEKVHRKS